MNGKCGLAVKPPRHFAPELLSPLEACVRAIELVKRAGFCHSWSSMKSEACYYKFPARHGVLRIATHSKGGKNANMKDGPTIVSITFPEANLKGFTPERIENHVANAIGIYLIRTAAAERGLSSGVEHQPSKLSVAGSIPAVRSNDEAIA